VLGPVAVERDAEAVVAPLGSRSQRIVLGVLAARVGETVPADVLVDALWEEAPPRTAAHTLRTYVSRLRGLVGDAIVIRPGGYALAVPASDVDARRFEALTAEAGRAARPEQAVALLDEALALWSGPAFGDVAAVDALRGDAVRLEELRLAAMESRAAALLRAGAAAEAAAAAEQLVTDHPLREEGWVVLVEALAGAGRARDALQAYQRAAAVLADTGLVPSPALRQAEAVALAGVPAAPLPQPRALPVSVSSLVGRQGELDALDELLTRARVVTLCGPGGVGKTRLALAAAERAAARHRFGARFVALASLEDPSALPGAVVDALGLSVDGGSPAAALTAAGGLDLLVVLDNCEHMVAEAARAAEQIVTGGPAARVLATSRERLGVEGEHTFTVSPLELGDGHSAAVELFLERARAVRPDLDPGPADLASAARITRRLDGLPLAIEMAAARAATLPLAELAERLDQLDHIDLTSPRRGVDPRHRTLAAVVEWSEALLSESDRNFLADLSIFAAPTSAADVAAVTGRADAPDALCRLAERSLLVPNLSGPEARFGMLDTIRRHAHRRLAATGRSATLARRHAEHVTAAAEEADRGLRGAREAEAAERLDDLTDDLRAAHRWARASDPDVAGRLSAALYLFGYTRLRDEPMAWAAELAADPGAAPHHAGTLILASMRNQLAGDLNAALALAEAAVEASARAGPEERQRAFEVLSDVHLFAGRLEASAAASRRVMAEAEAAGDHHGVVVGCVNLALAASYAGRVDEAESWWATASRAEVQAPSDQAWVAYIEGEVVLDRDPGRALDALDRAVALADPVGNRFVGGVARVSACSLRARVGDPDDALAAFAPVIDYWRRRGAGQQQLTTLRNLVVLLDRVGSLPEAAFLLGAVEANAGAEPYGEEAARLTAARQHIEDVLGHTETERRLAAGGNLTVDGAARAALEWLPSA
jgi:predicted ATPase/DNA-binding SARP family transcriptional activator